MSPTGRMAGFVKTIAAGWRLALDFARCEAGGPASEFALTAPIVIVLLLGTIQVAVIYTANAYLETVAENTARQVMTNQTSSMTQAQFQTNLCNNLTYLFTCANVMVNLATAASNSSISTAAPTFNANGTLANALSYSPPTPGQIGVLQVIYQWPVIGLPLGVKFGNLGNGAYLMMSTQVFMVEQAT